MSGILADDITLKYNLDFKSLSDNISSIPAELKNGAEIVEEEGLPVLSLGDNDGYLDMGAGVGEIVASLDSFSISTNLYISQEALIGSNGNFIYVFSNSDNSASARNGYMFLGANATKY